MKKRVLILAMLVLATALGQTGCANDADKAAADDPNAVYEILWHDRGVLSRDHDLVYEQINAYIEPIIGARVKNIPFVGSEYTEKMRLVLASKENFDICFTSSGANYEMNASNGAYLDVEEILNTYGKETKEQLPAYALDAARVNGVLYALPFYKDYSTENVFYYRKDLAEKYNLPMDSVKKLDDLEPILKTIKENEPSVYTMLFIPSLSPYKMLPFEEVAGGIIGAFDLHGDPTKIINPFETDVVMEHLKTMHRFYQQGFFRPEIATLTTNSDVEGSEFMNVQQELPYLVDQRNQTLTYEMGVLHLQEKPLLTTGGVRGSMIAFSNLSKNPEKAMEFVNLLNTDKHLRNLVAYGIEGQHYIAVGEDQYRLPEGVKTKEDTGYSTYVFTNGNKYLTRMIEGTPADIYDKYIEFDETSEKSPALGFAFDPSKMKSEYTAVSNAYNEFMPALLTGTADPEEVLPKALAKLKDAGLDKLLAEMQKQYDEWRAVVGKE